MGPDSMSFPYDTVILPTKKERIRCFSRSLRIQLRSETQLSVTMGQSFLDIIDHACTIEQLHYKAHGVAISGLALREAIVGYGIDPKDSLIGPNKGYSRVSPVILFCLHYRLLRVVTSH